MDKTMVLWKKNYHTIPKTMEFLYNMEQNFANMKKKIQHLSNLLLTIVNYVKLHFTVANYCLL